MNAMNAREEQPCDWSEVRYLQGAQDGRTRDWGLTLG